MKARAHITVKGYVQGGGFRWFVNDIAESLLLAGWVRNISGGSVEAVFEGEKSEIEKAIEQCYNGPSHAVVSQIDAVWDEAVEDLVGFNIKY
jgi:acylphosphatase